jgi:hypothetical protein
LQPNAFAFVRRVLADVLRRRFRGEAVTQWHEADALQERLENAKAEMAV